MVSIVFDIYFLLDVISVTFSIPTNATDVARAGRAGRAGTKAGRLLKIARMIRVFRVAKLYKETKRVIDERRAVLKNDHEEEKESNQEPEPENIVRKMSSLHDRLETRVRNRNNKRDSMLPSTNHDKSVTKDIMEQIGISKYD